MHFNSGLVFNFLLEQAEAALSPGRMEQGWRREPAEHEMGKGKGLIPGVMAVRRGQRRSEAVRAEGRCRKRLDDFHLKIV